MARMQESRSGAGSGKSSRTLAGKMRPIASASQQDSLNQYRNALQLMQEGKYDKARTVFAKLLLDGSPEIHDRTRMYLAVCERHATKPALTFANVEEQYDYAVSLLNTGHYEDARDHFEAILVIKETSDYAHYGLAILNSMTGQAEECLQHLARAIQLREHNRIHARSDADFQDMADDPRFTELLYPEGS
jgi:tetratricopeptide (TPR) repeat protein